MDPNVMDPSHPGYPAWIASKYPEDILDEINGVFPPPRSRNAIVPAAPAPTVAAVPPALAIDPALLALAPANHQTAPAQSNVQAAALPPPPPLPLPHAAPAFIAGPALIPPPAPANQALVLDQRTLEVLTVPNDGPNQAHALAAMQPNRRFQMKPGRTWRGHTHPSYSVSACAYVVGDVLLGNRRCHRCVANIGAYDQCVVVPGVRTNGQRWLSGACAGCFWGGHAEKCSFTWGDDDDDGDDEDGGNGGGGGKGNGKKCKRSGKDVGRGGGKRGGKGGGRGMGGMMGNGAGVVV